MKRYVAKALRGAAERSGQSPRKVKRRFKNLPRRERKQYREASFKRWLKDIWERTAEHAAQKGKVRKGP